MSQPTPAVVTQRAAAPLPRWALLLLCAAYVLPGVFGRDPWRNADLTAFGYMSGMAEGRMSWWAPSLGGLPSEPGLLPHWLGAMVIGALGGWIDPALAARLPFALLLLLTLGFTWAATYHLARSEGAQPVAFAFGGEAEPRQYAKALADSALLAMVATLGLLQLGHETTPELAQICACALFLWAHALALTRPAASEWAGLVSLLVLALSGAPVLATFLGASSVVVARFSAHAASTHPLRSMGWVGGTLLALGVLYARWPHLAWSGGLPLRQASAAGFLRLLLWFTWPSMPLALWTLWRWRRHWLFPHIAAPLSLSLASVASSALLGSSDRALLLAVPGLAILAAFALPTLKRAASSAIDWFSVFFFSVSASAVWVIYASMHGGIPRQPMVNILRLVPGFIPRFSGWALASAVLGTIAWLSLVRWRTSRHQHAIWKSLVLPAGGVALVWLLTMTLLLPALDYGRSTRSLVVSLEPWVPRTSHLCTLDVPRPHLAGLEVFGGYRLEAAGADGGSCPYLLRLGRSPVAALLPGWEALGQIRRPVDRSEYFTIYRRSGGITPELRSPSVPLPTSHAKEETPR